MDLLATVRKEGSRGGRGDFKWSDVQSSSHRENYLGHSLMAPVGRWQQNRDLSWYAKADNHADDPEGAAEKAARERKEEIRKIKEAEQDALAKALGFEVAPRGNPNLEKIGDKREVDRVLREAAADEADGSGGKGVGFGTLGSGPRIAENDTEDRIEGTAEQQDTELNSALREYKRRHGHGEKRRRSRSRDRDRRHDRSREKGHHHRRRSGSRERQRNRKSRSRSREGQRRSRDEKPDDRDRQSYYSRDEIRRRSRSPYAKRRSGRERSRSSDLKRKDHRRDRG